MTFWTLASPLLSGLAIPLDRFVVLSALGNSRFEGVHGAEVEPGKIMPLLDGLAIPLRRFGVVLWNAPSTPVCKAPVLCTTS